MNADFKLNGLVIETARLILRPFKETDIDDFYEYATVPGVGEMAGWLHHENKEITKVVLDSFIQEDRVFAICLKSTNKVIGSLGVEKYKMEEILTEFNNYQGRELGFVLAKEYWGRGLMPEAVNAVIDYLFNDLNLDFLTCCYYTFNTQSKRVQEKCGFKPYRRINNDPTQDTIFIILNLLVNPKKKITFNFSHPETLIHKD